MVYSNPEATRYISAFRFQSRMFACPIVLRKLSTYHKPIQRNPSYCWSERIHLAPCPRNQYQGEVAVRILARR